MPSKQTAAISLLGAVVTMFVMQAFAEQLAASPPLTIVGGMLAAVVHFFLLMCAGNLQSECGWATVLASLSVAAFCAGTVHGVSMTTGVLLSSAVTYYVHYYAQLKRSAITQRK
jgi:Keratinocyte-associated protein 2